MGIWSIFAALTIISLALVLWPLWRARDPQSAKRAALEQVVYKDQLAELERDKKAGRIGETEAKSAYAEIARRLLNASKGENHLTRTAANNSLIVLVVSAIAIAGFGGLLYARIGNPTLRDLPQETRLANAVKNRDMAAMMLMVERQVEQNPDNLRAWKVLAPALKRSGRFNDAANAYARIMQLDKPTIPLLVDYAESLILANNGNPPPRAIAALKAIVKRDPNHAIAKFYLAIALRQDGKNKEALAAFRELQASNPKNLRLQMAIQRQIIALGGKPDKKAPGPDADQMRAAANMTPEQRREMIKGMVDRLATRLEENGDDLDGWLRLIRARVVMGDAKGAFAAVEKAKSQFKSDANALARIEGLSKQLKVSN